MKAILGNPVMIGRIQNGFPKNGKPVPDGAMMAKVEWHQAKNSAAPYAVTVPGEQTEVGFMVKDSKRFRETNGWGYITFQYRRKDQRVQTGHQRPDGHEDVVPRVPHQRRRGTRLRLHELRAAVGVWIADVFSGGPQ